MRQLTLLAFLCMPFIVDAQQGSKGIVADLTGVFSLMRYSQDSLVAPARKGKTTLANENSTNIYYQFALKNPNLSIRAGLGYVERNMRMNRSDAISDFFIYIFSFDSPPRRDSFLLKSMQLRTHYLNVPVAAFYCLTKDEDRGLQVQVGLQLNPAFLINSKASLTYDENQPIPNANQQKATENLYTNTAAKFILGIQPRIDFKIRASNKAGFLLNLQPLHIYANSWNEKITHNSAGFGVAMGLYYHL